MTNFQWKIKIHLTSYLLRLRSLPVAILIRSFQMKIFITLLFLTFTLQAQSTEKLYDEPFRPQFHFTPEKNWMNDPNGLVYYKGEYHLFYQYNPFGNSWGHMSWGHAVSSDMIHWKHLPVALAEVNGVMIFSGSAVVDWNNSSGLCNSTDPKDKSCLVAIYTGHVETPRHESQHIAVSNDRGRTWTKFAGNPVLDIGSQDFRDPKVFWHEASKKWVMVVSLSKEQKVRLYGSQNLQKWDLLSEFGGAGVADKSIQWECPDLFELPILGQPNKKSWVMIVNINPGGFAGGSGGQYFVGNFDGKTFTNDNPVETKLFVDYGKDFYAGVTFSDVPKTDGRRILLGWMSNWEYAGKEPTSPWRTAQSLPRELKLRSTPEGLRLWQTPVDELKVLRRRTYRAPRQLKIGTKINRVQKLPLTGDALEIEGEFKFSPNSGIVIKLISGKNSDTIIRYDSNSQKLFIYRNNSIDVEPDFKRNFFGVHEAPLSLKKGKVKLRILVDRSSVEVFGNIGETAMSDRLFPPDKNFRLVIEGYGGLTSCDSLNVWQLKSIWK